MKPVKREEERTGQKHPGKQLARRARAAEPVRGIQNDEPENRFKCEETEEPVEPWVRKRSP